MHTQPKFTAMLFKPPTHLSGALPWSLLLPRGPHLQDESQILHLDSNQVLGDTEVLMALSGGRMRACTFCTNWGVAKEHGYLVALRWWLGQTHHLLDALWLPIGNLPSFSSLILPCSPVGKTSGLTWVLDLPVCHCPVTLAFDRGLWSLNVYQKPASKGKISIWAEGVCG